jgi:hypothetical protein
LLTVDLGQFGELLLGLHSESRFLRAKRQLTRATCRCCSGANFCAAFSEKLLLIISSTLNASTRSKLRIMLYVNLNCEAKRLGVPSIMSVRSLT